MSKGKWPLIAEDRSQGGRVSWAGLERFPGTPAHHAAPMNQFSVASHEYVGGKERAEFHNIVTWD